MRLSWLGLLVVLVGCGPGVETMDSSGAASTESGPEEETDGDSDSGGASGGGNTSGTGSTSGTTGSTSTTSPPETDIEIDDVSHSFQCIDGCEGWYYDERLQFTAVSPQTRTVEILWFDWTLSDRELAPGPNIIASDTIELPAGVPVEVDLTDARETFCEQDDWSAPIRVLLRIDDIYVEVEGMSSGSFGWDC